MSPPLQGKGYEPTKKGFPGGGCRRSGSQTNHRAAGTAVMVSVRAVRVSGKRRGKHPAAIRHHTPPGCLVKGTISRRSGSNVGGQSGSITGTNIVSGAPAPLPPIRARHIVVRRLRPPIQIPRAARPAAWPAYPWFPCRRPQMLV